MSEFNKRTRRCGSVGLAGAMILGSLLSAQAQEAAPGAQPVRAGCSGFLCVFAPPAPASAPPAPASAPPAPASAPAAEPVAASSEDTMSPPSAKEAAAPARAKPKLVRPITISADAAQAPRLHALAASMPRERIKVVASPGSGADFTVATAFDPHEGAAIAKLFTEDLHVVAGGAIRSLVDLKGKVVSFGADKSVSQAAGRKAFQALAINVREAPLDVDNALDGLSTGDIDAVVILAPQPVQRLKTLAGTGLHLVAWPDGGAVPDGAVAASIDGADYPGLARPGERIPAIGVDAVLTASPKAARSTAAKSFLVALSQHSTALSKHGFDLLKADLESRANRRVASAERR